MLNKVLYAAVIVLSAYFLWIGLLFFAQRYVLYPGTYLNLPTEPVLDAKELTRPTNQGDVTAYLVEKRKITEPDARTLVVFYHGNGETARQWPEQLKPYRRMGADILIPEYRGYDYAAGFPTQNRIVDDVVYFIDRLQEQNEYDKIIYHGRSLGGGVAAAVMKKKTPDALITESTFTSIKAFARGYLAPPFLVRDPYQTKKNINKHEDVPLLLFHGRHDTTVPVKHAEQLKQVRPDAQLNIMECSHNDCPPDYKQYWQNIYNFLQSNNIALKTPFMLDAD